jgi:hypothetical protein
VSAFGANLLERAADRCLVTVDSLLDGGGSGAVTAKGRDRDGRPVVLKCLAAANDVVDGHDMASFRKKQVQVDLLSSVAPAVSCRYPALRQATHEQQWSAYVFDYVEAHPLLLTSLSHGQARAQRALVDIWSSLLSDGYRRGVRPAAADHWESTYLARVARRRWLLARHVPEQILTGERIEINGVSVPGLDSLAAGARAVSPLFGAAQLAVPVHGDLNLRNLLLRDVNDPGGFTLIDPRGVTQLWDPLYDVAKMLFSLSLFEAAMTSGFDVTQDGGRFYVGLTRPNPFRQWRDSFVAGLGHLRDLAQDAGLRVDHWVAMVLLAHASHVIAEAACRLSDRAAPLVVRRNRCIGLLLLGMMLLDDLLVRVADGVVIGPGHLELLDRL